MYLFLLHFPFAETGKKFTSTTVTTTKKVVQVIHFRLRNNIHKILLLKQIFSGKSIAQSPVTFISLSNIHDNFLPNISSSRFENYRTYIRIMQLFTT